VSLTSADTATSPATLTVPQYDGGGTLTAVTLSIQPTETYKGTFIDPTTFQPTPGTATFDFVALNSVLEATAPGLSALSSVTPGVPVNGTPFDSFTAGDPLPALPSGVAATESQTGAGVSTGALTPSTWTGLGYGFMANSPAPASATGTATFTTTTTGSVPVANFGAYTGGGNVNVSAADYTEAFSGADFSYNGESITTSLIACVTYVAIDATTPEVPTILLLPIAALGVFGAVVFFSRRRRVA
jgi:hypothetical protein